MNILAGILLAIGVGLGGVWIGFDRERGFYPLLVIVIAAYYVLFAAMAGARTAMLWESLVLALFLLLAVAAFRRSLWLAVVALAAHGLFDLIHHQVIENPGVPAWWPGFCVAFDVVAALFLAALLFTRTRRP